MDEIKHKILALLNKQVCSKLAFSIKWGYVPFSSFFSLVKNNTKIPSMGFSDANYSFPEEEKHLSINSKTVTEADRPADQDILESIEAAYFSIDSSFDICRFELSVIVHFPLCYLLFTQVCLQI